MADARAHRPGLGHETAIAVLKQRFGERCSTAEAVRRQHGQEETYHPPIPPEAVVFANSTEEVAEVVGICREHHCPIVPYGTGTSLEGHIAALAGGISLNLASMDQVLEVNAEDLDCRVQAGVTRKALNLHLRDTGLFFPIDPGADASLGGMAATRASGTNAVRYGTMRDVVLGLTLVLADGRVVKSGGRARKSSAGYDLTRLFVGSEGTLGVITELQLKLFGIPEAIAAAVCSFETLQGAVDSVIQIIQLGIPVARIELLDEVQMAAVNAHSGLDYPEQPTLFFEFHGTEASVAEQAEMAGAIAEEAGGSGFRWERQSEARTKLWAARHDAYYANLAYRPGKKGWATDVCVPISRLADCVLETKRDLQESGLLAPIVGHVGDGNFHLTYLIDPDDAEEMARTKAHYDRLVMRALAMGGTSTGEHGIGYGKIPFLEAEHGEGVAVMRQIKQALDPDNLMNPGKIIRL